MTGTETWQQTSPSDPRTAPRFRDSEFSIAVAEGPLPVQLYSDPIRCASVLKPAYAWVSEHGSWERLARAMVTESSNEATEVMIGDDLAGVLERIEDRTGVMLDPASTWGRVLVTASQLATVYQALVEDSTPRSSALIEFMRQVPAEQRLGVPPGYAVKAGWDLYTDSTDTPRFVTNMVVIGSRAAAMVSDIHRSPIIASMWMNTLRTRGPGAVAHFHRFPGTTSTERIIDATVRAAQ